MCRRLAHCHHELFWMLAGSAGAFAADALTLLPCARDDAPSHDRTQQTRRAVEGIGCGGADVDPGRGRRILQRWGRGGGRHVGEQGARHTTDIARRVRAITYTLRSGAFAAVVGHGRVRGRGKSGLAAVAGRGPARQGRPGSRQLGCRGHHNCVAASEGAVRRACAGMCESDNRGPGADQGLSGGELAGGRGCCATAAGRGHCRDHRDGCWQRRRRGRWQQKPVRWLIITQRVGTCFGDPWMVLPGRGGGGGAREEEGIMMRDTNLQMSQTNSSLTDIRKCGFLSSIRLKRSRRPSGISQGKTTLEGKCHVASTENIH